jgi:RNA polymerase sigma-54 factor
MYTGNYLIQEQKQLLSLWQIESLNILAMSQRELYDFMLAEQEENPLINLSYISYRPSLTIKYGMEEDDFIANLPAPGGETVEDILLSQINLNEYSRDEEDVFRFIAGSVDSSGFLVAELSDLSDISGIPQEVFQKCARIMRGLEPSGVCASTIEECLEIQLRALGNEDELLIEIVRHHLRAAAEGALGSIAKALGCDISRVRDCMRTIRSLNPRPLNGLTGDRAAHNIPDIVLTYERGSWDVELTSNWYGIFGIDDYYEKLARETTDGELREYFRLRFRRARFLCGAIERRQGTLLRIGKYLALKQSNFLLRRGPLLSLTMSRAAKDLAFSPSTVGRAISGKYIQYPGGACAIAGLFARGTPDPPQSRPGSGVSQDEAKRIIRELVSNEGDSPFSDDSLATMLKKSGVALSRRTVAKYRSEMGIRGMNDRRRI